MKALQTDVNLIANSLFAKSRTNKTKYINTDTGVYFDINQYTEFIMSNLTEYENTVQEKVKMILEAADNLDFLSGHVADRVEKAKVIWSFFKEYFKNKSGKEVSFVELSTAYIKNFGNISEQQIMKNFADWTTEMDYPKTVKNKYRDTIYFIVILK